MELRLYSNYTLSYLLTAQPQQHISPYKQPLMEDFFLLLLLIFSSSFKNAPDPFPAPAPLPSLADPIFLNPEPVFGHSPFILNACIQA